MKTLALFSAAVAAMALVACGPDYDRMEFSGQVASPLGGVIDFQHVTVPEGMILKAHILPYNSDNERMKCVIHSDDPSTMAVTPVVNDGDFAFYGMRQGRTQITISADDHTVLVLDATVTPQPAAK